MLKLLSKGTLVVAALGGAAAVQAFSLIGPFETWQIPGIGYNPGGSSATYDPQQDIGAPKNISQEFRITAPIVTYGFDESFLEYFGPEGVKAVDNAFKVFNDLKPVSEFSPDLSEFPLATSRINYTAQRLGLLDIKSVTMGWIMETLGLTSPERYVWTLRQNNPDAAGNPQFLNIRRSFDPLTQLASSFVNNTLYTYYDRPFFNPDGSVLYYDANEISLDASEPNVSLASYLGIQVSTVDGRVSRQISQTSFGTFFTGPTRDDAGGIRYIYHPNNENYEILPAGATLRTSQDLTVIGTGTGGGFGGYAPAVGFGSAGLTNAVAPIGVGVRPGVNKITFIRVDTDPLLGRFVKPLVMRWSDTVTTNGVTKQQTLERIMTIPDMVIAAADLGTSPAPTLPFPWVYLRGGGAQLFQTPPANFSRPKDPGEGPGIKDFSALSPVLNFNTIGPALLNTPRNNTEATATGTFIWGSYDGTTNAPILYPPGEFTIHDLEAAALGGN